MSLPTDLQSAIVAARGAIVAYDTPWTDYLLIEFDRLTQPDQIFSRGSLGRIAYQAGSLMANAAALASRADDAIPCTRDGWRARAEKARAVADSLYALCQILSAEWLTSEDITEEAHNAA